MTDSALPPPALPALLDAHATAQRLPWLRLAEEIAAVLRDDAVQVPERLVQALPGGGSLFVMPALDAATAITKLITFTPGNSARGLPAIQGDVLVFDVPTGRRVLLLDGPTVTARRTAAVSLLAAQRLAPCPDGPLLIVGAGVQGMAHLEAFAAGLPVREVYVASRSTASAAQLVAHAQSMGLTARVATDADEAMKTCRLVVTCTPASGVVLSGLPHADTFIAAVGAFTPKMVELAPAMCRYMAATGTVIVDTVDARHEAGDLLQAGLDVTAFANLQDVVCDRTRTTPKGPVLFKSCGWAGWDLAAARAARAFTSG